MGLRADQSAMLRVSCHWVGLAARQQGKQASWCAPAPSAVVSRRAHISRAAVQPTHLEELAAQRAGAHQKEVEARQLRLQRLANHRHLAVVPAARYVRGGGMLMMSAAQRSLVSTCAVQTGP